ncbi:MAG: hypothetical protein IPH10_12585 [bacterium]|nr:hypothetical protein [bacterium]
MNSLATGLFALVILLATNANATIRYLSAQGAGQYTTIDAAGTAAVTGDTILVGPGAYSVSTVNQSTKRLTWIGAGWDQTTVNMTSIWYFNTTTANRTSVEGFNIQGGAGFQAANNCDSSTVRRCLIANPQANFNFSGGRGLTIEDCILYYTVAGWQNVAVSDANYPTVIRNCVFTSPTGSNSGSSITGNATSGTVEIYNCTFVNTRQWLALNTAGGPVIAVNNVFWDWNSSSAVGTYNAGSVFDYNAGPASPALPGTNLLTIASDPFVNYDESVNYTGFNADLHLHPTNGAALINSGHPSLLDFTDGSQSDRGVYGGPKPLVDNGVPNYPWAINVTASPNLVGVGTPINAGATVRVGPAY